MKIYKNYKRFIKLISLALCFILVTSVLSGCNKSSVTIRMPLDSVPSCLDPQIALGTDLQNIINNCFEGLVRIDADGKLVPAVAEKWIISEDGLTYTFYLRPDAAWRIPSGLTDLLGDDYEKNFNKQVSADDFAFALKRALDENTNAPFAHLLSCIKEAHSEGSTTLVITLREPNVNLMTTLASPICMPCNEEFFNATAGRYGLETKLIMSNGPYYVGNIDSENGITLYKNDSYKGNFKAISDSAKLIPLSAFMPENSDSSSDNQSAVPALTDLLLDKKGYSLVSVNYNDSEVLDENLTVEKFKNSIKTFCFNVSNETLALRDIRMAFAQAIDSSKLDKDGINAEGLVPSCCVLTAGVSYRAGSNIVAPPEYNLEAASSSLQKASEKLNEEDNPIVPDKISLALVCLKDDENGVKQVVQDWQKVFGVSLSVSISTVDTQDELDKIINSGAYDIAYTKVAAVEFLASEFLDRFTSKSGYNSINLKDSHYDNLVNKVWNSTSEEQLVENLKSCESYLVNNAYFVPTFAADSYIVKNETALEVSVRPSGTVYALYK